MLWFTLAYFDIDNCQSLAGNSFFRGGAGRNFSKWELNVREMTEVDDQNSMSGVCRVLIDFSVLITAAVEQTG